MPLHHTLQQLKNAEVKTSYIETNVSDLTDQQISERQLTQDLIQEAISAIEQPDGDPVVAGEALSVATTALSEATTVSQQADALSDIVSILTDQMETLQLQQQDSDNQIQQVGSMETTLQDLIAKVSELETQKDLATSERQDLGNDHIRIEGTYTDLENVHLSQTEAMLGDMTLIESLGAEDISAAALNAAAAGEFTKTFEVMLAHDQDGTDYAHLWANFEPVVTPSKGTVADGDVAAPTVENTRNSNLAVAFAKGIVYATVIFDTDAGATKTYVNGEALTVTIQVNATDTVAGWTVTQLVKTYNVIA